MTTQTQLIEGLLLDYFANSATPEFVIDELGINGSKEEAFMQILRDAQQDWEALPCDPEGETEEQNIKSDAVLTNYITKITNLINQ